MVRDTVVRLFKRGIISHTISISKSKIPTECWNTEEVEDTLRRTNMHIHTGVNMLHDKDDKHRNVNAPLVFPVA